MRKKIKHISPDKNKKSKIKNFALFIKNLKLIQNQYMIDKPLV